MNVVSITLTKLGSYKQNFKLMHHIRLKLISDLKNTFNYSKIQLLFLLFTSLVTEVNKYSSSKLTSTRENTVVKNKLKATIAELVSLVLARTCTLKIQEFTRVQNGKR